jgi:hypothetical protein
MKDHIKRYSIIKQNDNISAYVTEFVVDNEEDIQELPTNVFPGSTCIVTSTSNVYMLNNQNNGLDYRRYIDLWMF